MTISSYGWAPSASTPPSPQPRSHGDAGLRLPLPLGQPRVTYILLGINVLVWLAMTVVGGSTNTDVLIRFGAKANVLVADGQVWRLLTSMFLHVGLMHLLFNSYALFVFGMEVERLYGSARFLVIYLLAGLWGSLASFAFGPDLSAGASGAIFGLLGTMLAFFRRHRETFGDWGRQRLLSLWGVAVFNLVLGFTVPGIDNLAHLGGLLSGVALGWLLAPQYRVQVGEGGRLHVAERTSLGARWWVVALAVILLIASIGGAMAVQRQSASALILRGQRALEGGNLATAESFLREAVARDPDSAEAYFYLGVVLSTQDQMSEAARAYEDALRREYDLAEAHWNLALAYAALGRSADAIAEFEAFIALRPDSPDTDRARVFIAELRKSAP
jgi:rhomboid protease GluP